MSSVRFLCEQDPNFEKLYTIVGVFSDVPGCNGLEYAEDVGIPNRFLDYRVWCKRNGIAYADLEGRERYYQEVLDILMPWRPDVLILSGFMLRVTNPLLSKFAGRMLNVHPAFLSILNGNDERKYTGLNVVARAMEDRDPTGSTVHIVTAKPDMGPIVFESKALPYRAGADPKKQQDRMKVHCDGPAYRAALNSLITHGWPNVPWHSE